MNRFLLSAAIVATGWLAADHFLQDRRIQELERAPRTDPVRLEQIASELAVVRGELSAKTSEASKVREEFGRQTDEDRARLAHIESLLVQAERELADHGSRLASWQHLWSGHEPEKLEGSVAELRERLEQRWVALNEMAHSAVRVAEEDRAKLAAIDETLGPLTAARDLGRKWDDLLGPVVQLLGDTTVGSGVLLESRPVPPAQPTAQTDADDGPAAPQEWRTYVLTAWHVVRDIYGTEDAHKPVDVKLYDVGGGVGNETAHLLTHDVDLDLALLVLDRTAAVPHGARLAPRSRLLGVRIFDPVYAVGCPLGNDPIPTAGEIASTHHEVEGGHYWMISAPTYIGNSGGGIFDAQTHELLGIFSKIYTHGSMRSTIVPHMGLATPLATIYDWLDREGYAYLEAPETVARPQVASATR
jgi:S1-C subfamily serine protease